MSDRRVQLACLYSLYGFVVIFLIGWVLLAGFMPPPSPRDSPAEIQAQYLDNLTPIRVGLVMSIFASALLLPWGGAICAQIRRIEGPNSPITWAWAAAQGCVVIEFLYPCVFWLMAAFRPDDAEHVRNFNDLGWLPFLGIVCTGMFQMVGLAVVTLRDKRRTPLYPRWFAYFQLWCMIGVAPTGGVFIFKDGPLAYNGLLGCWIPVTVYFIWVMGTTIMTARAIKNPEELEPALDDRVAALERELEELRAAKV